MHPVYSSSNLLRCCEAHLCSVAGLFDHIDQTHSLSSVFIKPGSSIVFEQSCLLGASVEVFCCRRANWSARDTYEVLNRQIYLNIIDQQSVNIGKTFLDFTSAEEEKKKNLLLCFGVALIISSLSRYKIITQVDTSTVKPLQGRMRISTSCCLVTHKMNWKRLNTAERMLSSLAGFLAPVSVLKMLCIDTECYQHLAVNHLKAVIVSTV